MFESIFSKLTRIVRTTIRAIGAATGNAWLMGATILALFLVVS